MLYKIEKYTNELKGSYPDNPNGSIPDGFTDVEPNPSQDGFINIWNGTSWDLVEDFRGTTIYEIANGNPFNWNSISKWNEAEFTDIEPPMQYGTYKFDNGAWIAKTEAEIREEKKEEAKGSNPYTVESIGTVWRCDLIDQWKIQLAENQSANHSRKVIVQDALGEWHKLTITNSNKLQKAMFNKYLEIKGFQP
jgi:hypothetical protein